MIITLKDTDHIVLVLDTAGDHLKSSKNQLRFHINDSSFRRNDNVIFIGSIPQLTERLLIPKNNLKEFTIYYINDDKQTACRTVYAETLKEAIRLFSVLNK